MHMEKIELWKDAYRIGNDVIDEQHEELFHRIEKLLMMARSADLEENRKECEHMLDYLVEYTVFHFDSEEALQNRENYVDYEQHKKIHREFRNTVMVYRKHIQEDFSAALLKRFLGTLLTWLTVHVQGCDQKIMKNELITEQANLSGAKDVVENVMKKLLTKLYGIEITETTARRYGGELRGSVIIRVLLTGEDRHMLLFGLTERLVKILYNKISGLFIQNTEFLDELEESALIELGDIMASYIMGALMNQKITDYAFSGSLFFSGYSEKEFNTDHMIIDTQTKYGTLEVLYCRLNQ